MYILTVIDNIVVFGDGLLNIMASSGPSGTIFYTVSRIESAITVCTAIQKVSVDFLSATVGFLL